MKSWATALATLALATAGHARAAGLESLAVETTGCTGLDIPAFMAHLGREIAPTKLVTGIGIATTGVAAAVDCSAGQVRLRVIDFGARRADERVFAGGNVREIAIALAELVAGIQLDHANANVGESAAAVRARNSARTSPPAPRAARVMLVAGVRSNAAALGTLGALAAAADADLTPRLAAGLDLGAGAGGGDVEGGRVRTILASGAAWAGWQRRLGAGLLQVGLGFRLGVARLEGIPEDSTRAGLVVTRPWGGPIAIGRWALPVWRRMTLGLALEGGAALLRPLGIDAMGEKVDLGAWWMGAGISIGGAFNL